MPETESVPVVRAQLGGSETLPSKQRNSARLVISLDFELLWGVRDHLDRESYGYNILGARKAIPRILDIFARSGIHATWATVGFLFCDSKDELVDICPKNRPTYDNQTLSSYTYLDEVGRNEKADPYYFAGSLIRSISEAPGQEIASHTLSHYSCLEAGQTLDSFEADLRAAQQLAARRGIKLKSIVFPRNQYSDAHINICKRVGFTTFRGNPKGWAYMPTEGSRQTPARRALRLVDAYTGILGPHTFGTSPNIAVNVPASRFLRPCSGRLAAFHPVHVNMIKRELRVAAETCQTYHLWWHPHNFGRHLEDNLKGLSQIVDHFRRLQDELGMTSSAMADCE